MDKNTQQELIKELRGALDGINKIVNILNVEISDTEEPTEKPFNLTEYLKENLKPKEFKCDDDNYSIYYDYLDKELSYRINNYIQDIGIVYLDNPSDLNDIISTLNSHSITPQQLKDAYKELGWL